MAPTPTDNTDRIPVLDPHAGWPYRPPSAPPITTEQPAVGPPYGPPPYGPPMYGPPMAPPPLPGRPPRRRRRVWPVLVIAIALALLLGATVYAVTGFVSLTTTATRPQAGQRTAPSATAPAPSAPLPTTPAPNPGGPSTGTGTADWSAVAAAIEPGVVNIQSRMTAGIGAGTGMVLTADGQILTNNHVIDGASQIVVTTVADGKTYRANVVGADPADDVAVLKLVGASGLATIPLGNSDGVKVGDPIAAIGNAGGQGGEPDVAPGSVVALNQQITATDQGGGNPETLTGMIQVAADLQPGDSGGPLADASGKAIGIDTAASAGRTRYHTTAHEGFAIPINRALAIARELVANPTGANGSPSGGASTAGYLGVEVQSAPAGGAQIAGVETGGPAEGAGLKSGDVVTAIDGSPVRSASELSTAVQRHASGDRVALTWTGADGRQHRATVTLG
jgi:S1-C subfamily serine protease